MKTKKSTRFFSFAAFVLSLIMIFGAFPAFAFGDVGEPAETGRYRLSEPAEQTTVHDELDEIETKEMTDLREENVKHFQLPDGSTQAVVYPGAVHRKDRNGNWQDIDNRLYLSNSRLGETGYATADGRVRVGEGLSAGTLLTISENGYEITLTPVSNGGHEVASIGGTASAQGVGTVVTDDMTSLAEVLNHAGRAQISDDDTAEEKLAKLKAVENRTTVKYNAFRQNAALEYVLDGNDVKENIIVSTRGESYSYAFTLRLEGLAAVLCADGSIELKDAESGETKYLMPAPYMYDAEGNLSEDVHYNFADRGNGEYYIAVIASPEWINESGRAFPVTIDPTVTKPIGSVTATYIKSTSPNTNYGQASTAAVNGSVYALFKFEMPMLPEGATITSATLGIFCSYKPSDNKTTSVGVHTIYKDWETGTATANYFNGDNGYLIRDYDSATTVIQPFNGMSRKTFSILEQAQMWFNGTQENYGVALYYDSYQEYTPSGAVTMYLNDSNYGPVATINYDGYLPDGVYSFENVAYDNYYLSVENASAEAGASLVQSYYGDALAPSTSFARTALFKIHRVSGSNYVIRSMLNTQMGISFDVDENSGYGSMTMKELPALDANADDSMLAEFVLGSNGYNIGYSNSFSVAYAEGASSGEEQQGQEVTMTPGYDSESARTQWKVKRYTGSHRSGFSAIPSSLTYQKATEIPLVGWTTYIDYNTIVPSISGSSHATMTWDATAGVLTLNGQQLGNFVLYLAIRKGTVNCYSTSQSIRVQYIADGTYYIRNKNITSGETILASYIKYQQSGSNYCFTSRFTYDFENGDAPNELQWIVQYDSDSYYKIINPRNGKYLTLRTGNTVMVGESTALSGTDANRQLWKPEMSGNGSFTLKSKYAVGSTSYWLSADCTPTTGSINGVTGVSSAYDDDWFFAKVSDGKVKQEAQHQSNFCWAASARMMCSTLMDSPITQEMVAKYVHGNYTTDYNAANDAEISSESKYNKGGTIENSKTAIDYILGASGFAYGEMLKIYSESNLKNLLDAGNVVNVGIATFNNGGSVKGIHASLIFDYYTREDGVSVFRMYDPLPVGEGSCQEMTYSDLVLKVFDAVSDTDDQGTKWVRTLVFKTGNYTDTITVSGYWN